MQATERRYYYTPQEYLELEISSEIRNEYINGEIITMTGGTPTHNQITGNLYAHLNFALKRQTFRAFVTDQRLWIPQKRTYTYPDVMITPREFQLQEGRKDTIVNPIAIAEVLSKSTRDYDHGEKFSAYRTIPSFQEYLLIDQYSIHVEHYSKTNANQWLLSEYEDPNFVLSFTSFEFQIAIKDLYDEVDFDAVGETESSFQS
ncbi:Uma2 family endonuclease [Phormidesmis sp. 146-12]